MSGRGRHAAEDADPPLDDELPDEPPELLPLELLLEVDDSDLVPDELLASDDFSDFSAGLSALPFALAAVLDPLPERLSFR